MANLDMPKDLRKFILEEQGKIKAEKNIGKFSIHLTIWKLLRELKEIRDKNASSK